VIYQQENNRPRYIAAGILALPPGPDLAACYGSSNSTSKIFLFYFRKQFSKKICFPTTTLPQWLKRKLQLCLSNIRLCQSSCGSLTA